MADIADRAGEYMERSQEAWNSSRAEMKARAITDKAECDCGEPISKRRQELGAIRCIDCQDAAEKKGKGYGLY